MVPACNVPRPCRLLRPGYVVREPRRRVPNTNRGKPQLLGAGWVDDPSRPVQVVEPAVDDRVDLLALAGRRHDLLGTFEVRYLDDACPKLRFPLLAPGTDHEQ